MQTREFDYKGKKIIYRTKGSGPLVVLIHGFGEDATVWNAQLDLFPGHQLIVADLPGIGGSEIIDDMRMEGLAEMISGLIEAQAPSIPQGGSSQTQALRLENTDNNNVKSQSGAMQPGKSPFGGQGGSDPGLILIGHSMGGYITLAFAEKYPEKLKAFGLSHSTAFADSEEKKEVRRKGINFIKQHGSYEFLKTSTPNLFAPLTKENRGHLVTSQVESLRNVDDATLVSYYESMIKRPDRTEVLKKSKVPVLFVMGKFDKAVPVEDVLRQCHLPHLSYIELLRNSGHMGMIEETERSNKIVTEFMKTL